MVVAGVTTFRTSLLTFTALALLPVSGQPHAAEPEARVKREVFVESPAKGATVLAYSFYMRPQGVDKMRLWGIRTESDSFDAMYRSFSTDNGITWSEAEKIDVSFKERKGVRRLYPAPGFLDPINGRLLSLANEAVFPTEKTPGGIRNYHLRYRVSIDGGKTWTVDEQIIQKGDYTPRHPVDGVWLDRGGCVMIGQLGTRPIRTRKGHILVPVQIAPVDRDGNVVNPGGGVRYYDAAVLIGAWDDRNRLVWEVSQRVRHDPKLSTRGAFEPAIVEMPDGRVLMVVRGSNAPGAKDRPGYKWFTASADGGFTWEPLKPWTYDDGANFFSPSSCSQLLRHSSGKIYWLGNITPENPDGNLPARPLVMGEADPSTLLLRRRSVVTIDDKGKDDDPRMMLNNFLAHEDRKTGEIVLNMSRPFAASSTDRSSHAYLYRVKP